MSTRWLKHLLLTLLAALWALPALAGSCPPPFLPPSAEQLRLLGEQARDRGFLWTIEKNGRTSYLYGTIHAARLAWASPGPRVRDAVLVSRALALELDLSDPDIARQLRTPRNHAPRYVPNTRQRARLNARMRADCVDPGTLQALPPELQLATLALVNARRDGLEASYGSELVLTGVARSLGYPVLGLETTVEQRRALQPANADEARALIDDGLNELESGATRRVLARLAAAWAESDSDTLASYAQWCECVDTEAGRAQLKRLLDDRNPTLAARIDTLHRSHGPVFFGVGALHMFGPDSLPGLLQAREFKVMRVL